MTITAAMVKELRERTGAGMMECKKALVETDGDLDAAADLMRKSGLAKADKRAGRVAAEGMVAMAVADDGKSAAMAEVNCETDFVAGGDDFRQFAESVAELALAERPADLEALLGTSLAGGTSVEQTRRELVARIGENIAVRRFRVVETQGRLGTYLHGKRIGVIVAMTGGSDELARDLAMHVAASSPLCVTEAEVPVGTLAKEREILVEQARGEGKPEEIVQKMVEGRVRKYLAGITLVGQPFVKDPDITVGKLLKQEGAEVSAFVRYEVGEGIEKRQDDFVGEVMAQVRGA